MIEIKKDKKSVDSYTVTKTDSEGFHHQINLTRDELLRLNALIMNDEFSEEHESQNPALSIRIEDCNLSVRARSHCKHNGIETLGDLTKITKTDFYKFRNVGIFTLGELDDLLKEHGLTWAK